MKIFFFDAVGWKSYCNTKKYMLYCGAGRAGAGLWACWRWVRGRALGARQAGAGRAVGRRWARGRQALGARQAGAGRAGHARPGLLGWPWAVHSVHSAHFRSVLTRFFFLSHQMNTVYCKIKIFRKKK